jgi:rod shape-determining protein MreD
MQKRIHLYGLLLAVTLIQMVCMKLTPWFPDVMLLMVIFVGIFGGHAEGIKFGFLTGLLRGSLSVHTFPMDLFLFPLVGALSAFMAEAVYRQNPVVELFITTVDMLVVIIFHAIFLKMLSGNVFLSAWGIFAGSFRTIIVTLAFSPLFYSILRNIRPQEE